MTTGQTRVLVLLLILLALEAVKQPAIKQQLVSIVNAVNGNANAAATGTTAASSYGAPFSLGQVAYWVIGALAIVALAAPAPDMATLLVIVLIVLVVLSDVSTYAALLTPPAKK
jgi:hypothetical protein